MKRRKPTKPQPKETPPAANERDELRAGDEVDDGADGLREAEAELGISEWIDPDTGGPAEDSVPRLEDH